MTDKKKRRVRHPKKEKTTEQKKHFVLEVQDGSLTGKSKIGK